MTFSASIDHVWSIQPILKVIYRYFEIIKFKFLGECKSLLCNRIIIINSSKNIARI